MKNNYNPFLPEKTTHDEDSVEKWLRERAGNFNGSKISELMSSSKAVSRKPWSDPGKVFGVGASFYRYVFQVAMERKTGCLDHQAKSFNLDYGHENEPLVIENLIKKGIIQTHSKCESIQHEEFNIKATPDGRITANGEVMALEIKSSVSWDGCYKRKKSRVDDKHTDFWQIQTEMLVLGVKKCLYIVTYPMSSEDYTGEIVEASEMHQRRLIERVKLAEACIKNWDFEEDIEASIDKTIKEEYAKLSV